MNQNKPNDKNKRTLTLKLQTIRQLAKDELHFVAGGIEESSSHNPNSGCCTNHPN
jgi:hypothetical protein